MPGIGRYWPGNADWSTFAPLWQFYPGPWNVSRVEWKPSGLQVRINTGENQTDGLNQGALVPVTLGGSHPLGKTALYEGDAYVIQYAVRCHPPSNSTEMQMFNFVWPTCATTQEGKNSRCCLLLAGGFKQTACRLSVKCLIRFKTHWTNFEWNLHRGRAAACLRRVQALSLLFRFVSSSSPLPRILVLLLNCFVLSKLISNFTFTLYSYIFKIIYQQIQTSNLLFFPRWTMQQGAEQSRFVFKTYESTININIVHNQYQY